MSLELSTKSGGATKRPADMDNSDVKRSRVMDGDTSEYFEDGGSDGEMNASSSQGDNFGDNYKTNHGTNGMTLPSDQQKKKVIIKNFKGLKLRPSSTESTQLTQKQNDQTDAQKWETISDNVHAIFKNRGTDTALETLFKLVEEACEKQRAAIVYESLLNIVRQYCVELKSALDSEDIVPLSEDNCEDYLSRFWKIWTVYPVKMDLVRNIFLYLDRVMLSFTGEMEVLPVWEATMRVFRNVFFPDIDQELCLNKLFVALFYALQRIMRHLSVDSTSVRELLSMISTVHVNEEFMNYFITQLRDHYNKERTSLLPKCSCREYMRNAYEQEKEYAAIVERHFCEPQAMKIVTSAITNCLIDAALPEVLHHGFGALLESEDINDVRCMYSMCSKCPQGEEHVRINFTKYIKDKGAKLMATCQDDDLFHELLAFKKSTDKILNEGFGECQDLTRLRQASADAFESFVNTKGNRAAELIAKYFHGLLRKCNKSATDSTLDQMLDDAIVVFRFIHGKDVFEAFYKRDLAKRLLLGRSGSVDAEKSVLGKLRNECGAGFTHKLEGMFKDMEISEDMNRRFQEHLEHDGKPRSNVALRILTTDHWPTYDLYEINLPKQMRDSLTDFSDFYKQQYSTRTLNWHFALSDAVVSAKFRPGYTKELIVSLYQAVVLLLFNECEKWTVQEIVDATKIEKTEVVRTILSLLGGRGKPRILLKHAADKISEESADKKKAAETSVETVEKDTFVVNTKLEEKLFRIRVSQVQLKTTKEDKEKVEAEVSQDRQYQIDAAVVRVMKARKNLIHSQLMQEVFAQLKFPVKGADIKTRISSLIDRDYIAREVDDPNKYKYVA